MKFAPSLFTLALISAFAVSASAQSASAPTRAEVKAETAAAKKAGEIPSGQESTTGQSTPKKPAKTGDAEKRVLVTEYTLLVNNEAAHGVAADIYGMSASS